MTGSRLDTDQYDAVYRAAFDLYSRNPNWVTFYRKIMGVGGIIRQSFSTSEALGAFERSDTFQKIQQMLGKLREKIATGEQLPEGNRVITVRLPESLHETLRVEAHEYRTSVNKLCISKLLQFIENELVPEDKWTPKKSAEKDKPAQEDKKPRAKEGTGVDL